MDDTCIFTHDLRCIISPEGNQKVNKIIESTLVSCEASALVGHSADESTQTDVAQN